MPVVTLKWFFKEGPGRMLHANGVAERIGMQQSLLSLYISGKRVPSRKQLLRIQDGVHKLAAELIACTS